MADKGVKIAEIEAGPSPPGPPFIRVLDTAAEGMAWLRTQLGESTKYMARLGGWVMLGIAFFITSDVVTRKWGHLVPGMGDFSSKATDEMSNYALAVATAWGMGYALLTRAHVRVDIVLVMFPKAVQGYLNMAALLLLNFLLGYVVYLSWNELVFLSFEINAQAPTIARTPLGWPQSIWAVGLTVFFTMAFVMLLESLLDAARGRAKELAVKIGPSSVTEELEEALEASGLGQMVEDMDVELEAGVLGGEENPGPPAGAPEPATEEKDASP